MSFLNENAILWPRPFNNPYGIYTLPLYFRLLSGTTKCEGLLHTISLYVTSAPFPRITNDVDLDARQPLINRVFNYSMIPIKSRESSFNPNFLGQRLLLLEDRLSHVVSKMCLWYRRDCYLSFCAVAENSVSSL